MYFCKEIVNSIVHVDFNKGYIHEPLISVVINEPRHAKRALWVILIKMFISLFSECTFFIDCEILSTIVVKISFLWSRKHEVSTASFAASIPSGYLRNVYFLFSYSVYEH